ncbi:MAG: hypothetical protein HOQ19_13895 [Gemmatimonadaceae bacterium]|nr:hypothetical protein [Gemmatimonadaceae bacterium]
MRQLDGNPMGTTPHHPDMSTTDQERKMTQPSGTTRDESDRDLARVSDELAGRLRARGVGVHDDDSPEAIVALVEDVEAFERAVEAHGGDLMMDEPPAHHAGQPDDPHFLIPVRGDDESFTQYRARLVAATAAIRGHKPHS